MTAPLFSTLGRVPGTRAIRGALATFACAFALTACGGGEDGGTIPAGDGEDLLAQLDRIDSLITDGECDAAQAEATDFAEQVSALSGEVEGNVRDALVDASANLAELSQDQCEPAETGASGEEGAVPEEPVEPEPAPVEPEAPIEPEAPVEPETPVEPEVPEDDDEAPGNSENSNGNPGQGGGDGGDSGGIGSDGD